MRWLAGLTLFLVGLVVTGAFRGVGRSLLQQQSQQHYGLPQLQSQRTAQVRLQSKLARARAFAAGPSALWSNTVGTTMVNVVPSHDAAASGTTTAVNQETYAFESNVARVMDIIINSLYSNKDVFIRELISNAADACDKKKYFNDQAQREERLKIRVTCDRAHNRLIIEDNGIGMNKEELIQNLGRIAESGTKRFFELYGKDRKQDMSLIGQFGVGFYSGFLVANKITVITKGSKGVQDRREANQEHLNQYTINPDDSEAIEGTGTRIILHLKEESDAYLDDKGLRSLIEKYSEFTSYPIEMLTNVTRPQTLPDLSKPLEPDGSTPTRTVMQQTLDWEVINQKKPLWLRNPNQCTGPEYEEFYRQTFKAYDKFAAYSHFAVQGNCDFKALLFLPNEMPYELTRDMFSSAARSMRLYVKRVFINDKFEDLIPRWLLFVRGVVDSDELSLNVGREILQQSRSLRIIKHRLIKKSLEMMHTLAANNATGYDKFWNSFGRYLKIGVIEDEYHREDIVPLLRFISSYSVNESLPSTSITDYVARMPAHQKYIYYAVGDTIQQAAMNPSLEKLRNKGYEVIYVSEPIDEMTLQNIQKVSDRQIVDVARETSQDLTEEEKDMKAQVNEQSQRVRMFMKKVLGNRILRVEASTRLVEAPAILIQGEYGVSPNMQKYLKAQAAVSEDDQSVFGQVFNQGILEINSEHPIIRHIELNVVKHNLDSEGQEKTTEYIETERMVKLLFSTSALSSGYTLENSVDYSKSVIDMISTFVKKSQ